MLTESLKEQFKARLHLDNPAYRYYKTIFNATPDMIVITDGDVIFDANTSFLNFCELYVGASLESCSFPSLFEKVDKFGYVYDGYQNKRWFETILEGKKEHYCVGVLKKEVLKTFTITLKPLEPLEAVYIATLTNVTEMIGYKTTLEEGIKSSLKDRDKTQFLLRQYDKAMEAATLVFKCDVNGVITFANRALSETFLYGNGDLEGKHFSILRGKSITDEMHIAIWDKVKKGKIYQGILELADKLGGSRYLDVSFIPIISQEGEIIEFFSLSHEITEVMKAKESAIKTLETKNKFFDQVSHELRTPLNAIVNFTDQALENFDEMFSDEETRDLVQMYIERSHKNSQHLLKLINSLLDMAKLRAGKEQYEVVVCDAVSLVKEVYETTSSLNTKMGVKYLIDFPPYALLVKGDNLKIHQCVSNLVSNAIKFTHSGAVRLAVAKVGDECWITVEDTGAGIPENKLESIFEPFEQVSAHDQGTGLGLGIVNEYAKGMGMKLDVVSTLGRGSRFTLKIKLEKPVNEDD